MFVKQRSLTPFLWLLSINSDTSNWGRRPTSNCFTYCCIPRVCHKESTLSEDNDLERYARPIAIMVILNYASDFCTFYPFPPYIALLSVYILTDCILPQFLSHDKYSCWIAWWQALWERVSERIGALIIIGRIQVQTPVASVAGECFIHCATPLCTYEQSWPSQPREYQPS